MLHLRIVLEILKDVKLYGKLSKSEFRLKCVSFLGHISSRDGILVDPNKAIVVKDWPIMNSVMEVRSSLGLTSYYRRLV